MPSLGDLECQIEEASTGDPFVEYGTAYGDGVVETYVVIPSSPENFSVRLRSKGYIYEGLAALVFMDGEYQCNRNRLNLKPPKKGLPRSVTEINFRMRQKEKPVGDGSFIGREWRFDTHNQIPDLPQDAHSGHFDNLGTIEILVLRCSSSDDTRSNSSSGLDVDPLSHSEIEDSGSEFGDVMQEQNAQSSYVAPAVAGEDDRGSLIGGLGLFDGADDRPDQPNSENYGYLGHPPYRQGPHIYNDRPDQVDFQDYGYLSYAPYQRGPNVYNDSQQWGPQPGYHPSYPLTGFPPHSQQPSNGPGKRVHFDMGGPPNTRAVPPPPHVHVPPPAVEPSSHGAGQQSGYPTRPYPVPFDAMPPFPGPPMPAYGAGAGPNWGSQVYTPLPIHPGYGYGYGAAPGYSYPNPGFYRGLGFGHAQGYGQAQGGPMHGPASHQNGNTNNTAGDPAKDENNADQALSADNNTGGDGASGSNESGGDTSSAKDGWGSGANNNNSGWNNGAGNNDTSAAANDWSNNDTNTDNANGGGTENGSGDEKNQNDTSGDNNNDSSNQLQMGGTYEASNTQQDAGWGNPEEKKTWPATNPSNTQPQNNAHYWGSSPNKPDTSTSMPDSFPTTKPRPLYGPHGAYYLPHAPPTPSTCPPISQEEPRYDVPQSHIATTSSTHQVVPGQGYIYSHRLATPVYRDSISHPYARFVFKYRNAAQLAAEIGVSVDGMNPTDEEMAEFATKSKEDIINMLLRAKAALGGKIPGFEDEEEGAEEKVKPVVVPAPVRRLPEYKIPVRAPTRKAVGLGLSNYSQGSTQQQQQQQQTSGNSYANNTAWDASGSGNTNGYVNSPTPQNSNNNMTGKSSWETSNDPWNNADKGNAGNRPASSAGGSPTPQHAGNNNNGGQDWSATADAGSGGASGW